MFVNLSPLLGCEAAWTFTWGSSVLQTELSCQYHVHGDLLQGSWTMHTVQYCRGLQIELELKAADWIKMIKTKSTLRVWDSGCLCCRIEKKLSIRPCLDLQYLTGSLQWMNTLRAEVCSVWWYTLSRMSHSLSRQLEQVYQSELEQESEQKQGWGDARAGMGTCCCSCLPLGQGTDLADHETEVVAGLEPSSLEKEEKQIETR